MGVARPRVWCFTPNPVLETKFEPKTGRVVLSAGGKAHNVARQLCRWGLSAISLVADCGKEWSGAARRDGPRIVHLPVKTPARRGWAVLDEAGKRLDFFTPDPAWKGRDWGRVAKFLRGKIAPDDWLVVAGSVPKGAGAGWWRTLFLGLRKKRVRLLADSRGTVLREALDAGVDWAKGNLNEAEVTTGAKGGENCLRRMRQMSRKRSSCIVTLGPAGLLLEADEGQLRVRSPIILVRDATGSGDVVTAALIYGCFKGWPLKKTAGWASRMGAANAARADVASLSLRG